MSAILDLGGNHTAKGRTARPSSLLESRLHAFTLPRSPLLSERHAHPVLRVGGPFSPVKLPVRRSQQFLRRPAIRRKHSDSNAHAQLRFLLVVLQVVPNALRYLLRHRHIGINQ